MVSSLRPTCSSSSVPPEVLSRLDRYRPACLSGEDWAPPGRRSGLWCWPPTRRMRRTPRGWCRGCACSWPGRAAGSARLRRTWPACWGRRVSPRIWTGYGWPVRRARPGRTIVRICVAWPGRWPGYRPASGPHAGPHLRCGSARGSCSALGRGRFRLWPPPGRSGRVGRCAGRISTRWWRRWPQEVWRVHRSGHHARTVGCRRVGGSG